VTVTGLVLICLTLLALWQHRTIDLKSRTIADLTVYLQRLGQAIVQQPLMQEALDNDPGEKWVIEDEYEVDQVLDPEWIGEDPEQFGFGLELE